MELLHCMYNRDCAVSLRSWLFHVPIRGPHTSYFSQAVSRRVGGALPVLDRRSSREETGSHSLRPHGLQPTRLLCPWGFAKQEY